MYDYIKGILIFKNSENAVIENNGIGYRFLINSRTSAALGEINDEIKLYTKLIHREDVCLFAVLNKRKTEQFLIF